MGTVLLLTYLLIGFIIGIYVFDGEERLKRLWLGGVIGMMLLMWSHVPFSFLLGFTVLSHVLGLVLSLAIGAVIIVFVTNKNKKTIEKGNKFTAPFISLAGKITKNEIVMLACVIPFVILSVVLLESHTLQKTGGAYYTGQCTFGDMNMHLGFITSLAKQKAFPPTYSILPGEPLNYPFLCDSISSSLCLFGSSLKTSYVAPMVSAFTLVYVGVWYLAEAILKKAGRTSLAYAMFFLDGGFGFIYFIDNWKTNKANFTRIFTAFYETPTNYVSENVRWTNVIADMLLPQRATLFGWMCLFAVLYVLYKAVFEDEKKYYPIAGIMAGLLPMIHTHSYFSVGLIAIAWIVVSLVKKFKFETFKKWCLFGIPALLLSVPQLLKWTFNAVGGESFLRFTFNWINSTAGDSWLWFWVKNLGLVFLLIPTAFIHADKKKKCVYSGALLIFVVAEFIIFQPNLYDNIKLFFVWYLYMAIMVADLLCDVYEKIRGIRGRQIIAAIVVLTLTLSGALTIAREVVSGTEKYRYQLYNEANVAAAEWIEENTEPTAVFLSWNNHNNTISSLTGRNIFVGTGTFLYFHGVNYQEKETLMRSMFENPEVFEENKNAVDYVYIGDYERGSIGNLNQGYFDENYPVVYNDRGITIYKIG